MRSRLRARLVLVGVLLVALILPSLRVTAGATAIELHAVEGASFMPGPTQPVFILVLGSDERAGLDGARSDAIHLVGVNPAAGRGTIINIPRDTYVEVPGHGRNRINEAYNIGGPQLAAATVAYLTGVQPSLVAVTTFPGLAAMVDELGGLEMDVPMPMNDVNSGAVFPGGRQRLSGAQVLALSRNRYIPGGDFTRTANQGHILLSALTQLRGAGASPSNAVRWTATLVRHTRLEGVGVGDLYRLGVLGLSFDPAAIRNVTAPATLGWAGRNSVVYLRQESIGLFADFRDDAVLQSH